MWLRVIVAMRHDHSWAHMMLLLMLGVRDYNYNGAQTDGQMPSIYTGSLGRDTDMIFMFVS